MTRDDVPVALRDSGTMLTQRSGAIELRLSGSFARDDASANSNIDLMVRFDGLATSKRYFGARFYIEDLLERPVDLVTDKALCAEFRPYVERCSIPAPFAGVAGQRGVERALAETRLHRNLEATTLTQ